MTYKWKKDIILTTVVTVVLSFVGIWLSTLPAVSNIFTDLWLPEARPSRPSSSCSCATHRRSSSAPCWCLLFCYLGSVLPIWSWAQPINYVSFWIVVAGHAGRRAGPADLAARHG